MATDSPTPRAVTHIVPAVLTELAAGHDAHAEAVATWAATVPVDPEQILATHGKVAYQTYLDAIAHTDSRRDQGLTYAGNHTITGDKLRGSRDAYVDTDDANAIRFSGEERA